MSPEAFKVLFNKIAISKDKRMLIGTLKKLYNKVYSIWSSKSKHLHKVWFCSFLSQ